ncbi:MAG: SLC13 family permease [Candidatus Omnitrophota bacterium]
MEGHIFSLVIFLAAYILFILFPGRRPVTAAGASLVLILTRMITPEEAFLAINWNVMGIFVGTLIVADVFMESRVPAYIAEIIVARAKNTCQAILFICLLTGFISAFVENVATVLIVAPIAFSLANKIKMNPVNMLIAIAVSSNLQGAATLIGDPPSMLLGGFTGMNFMDFFVYKGRPSIFFAVEAGAMVSFIVLFFIFRSRGERPDLPREEKVRSWTPTVILAAMISALAVSSFFDTGFSYMAGAICMVAGAISMVWEKFVNRGSILQGIKALDWETTFFLMGVFVLVGSVSQAGWVEVISNSLSHWIKGDIFLGYTLIVVISVLLSAFIDNVPFLVAMFPVAVSMADKLQINPSLFLFGLLIGASLGGNLTPIGASANIVACGLLRKEGYKVSFGEFMRIGIPFTLSAVGAGYLFIWIVWK